MKQGNFTQNVDAQNYNKLMKQATRQNFQKERELMMKSDDVILDNSPVNKDILEEKNQEQK